MASKKKSKGVLDKIGNVATSAAEVVIDAGAKAIHAVGDMMPAGTTKKGAKASKVKPAKASPKSPKAAVKSSKPQQKVEAKTKTAAPKAKQAAIKKATPVKSAKAAPTSKAKRPVGRKG